MSNPARYSASIPTTGLRDRLIQRLQHVVGLPAREAEQAISEVLDLFGQTVDDFITTRHAELQSEGHKTTSSYEQIQRELTEWRFAAPPLTLRQIRRRLYG